MRPRRPRAGLPAALLLLAASPPAWPHGGSLGLSGFFGGLLHPLLVPAHLISLLVLGLALGQRGMRQSGAAVYCGLAGIACGLLAAGLGHAVATDLPLLLGAALLGGAVAAARPLPAPACLAMAGLVGLGIGLGSPPEAASRTAQAVGLVGTGLGAGLALLYVACATDGLDRPWLRVLVRVAGSWIAAGALLAWALWMAGGRNV